MLLAKDGVIISNPTKRVSTLTANYFIFCYNDSMLEEDKLHTIPVELSKIIKFFLLNNEEQTNREQNNKDGE